MLRTRKFAPEAWQRNPGIWRGSLLGDAMGSAHSLVFYETDEIGKGPALHIHPYAETFILIEGHARYQIGDAVIDASAGDILTAPADIPHKFTNLGPGRLRTVDIHHSPDWIQTNLE